MPVVLIALLLLGWGIDSSLNSGNVARNVTIAGADVGGLDRDELGATLNDIAAGYADTAVTIRTDDGVVQTTAGVVGLELDPEATADQVMGVGRGNVFGRPFSWLGGLFGSRRAEAAVRLGSGDPDELARLVNAGQPEPVEPSIAVVDDEVVLISGESVEMFDLATVRDDVLDAARAGTDPIQVQAGAIEVFPLVSDDELRPFADELSEKTAGGIVVQADGESRRIDPAVVRSWMVFDLASATPALSLDPVLVQASLAEAFGRVADLDTQRDLITVVNGRVRLDRSSATACCAADSNERILEALQAREAAVELELGGVSGTEREILEELGIIELVGEATTPHRCCESRVTNIQLFADLMTGVILDPDESISLNEFVGPRTAEKGFVESGVIYLGRLQTDIGGGISQFATTIFQAMFFGGIDIDAYQAHTLWFSRYADFEGRQGIESTISFPQPDVQFTNNTPYPLLIWPTYTDTSLTVSLYSTKWGETEVAQQDIYGSGQCTVIDTERLRTYPDGTEETDEFRAFYQPGDNIGCDGRPTDPSTIPTPTPEPTPDESGDDTADDSSADAGADDGTDSGADGSGDAGADSGADAGADAGADSGADGSGDAGADSGADGGADAGADAGADSGADGGADAGADAGADGSADDSSADAGADGTADDSSADGSGDDSGL